MSNHRRRFQFSLGMLFVAMIAFALGFGARNVATSFRPWAMSLFPPTPAAPVAVGDALVVESLTDPSLDRRVAVQPDGTIVLPLLGNVPVSGQNPGQIEQTLGDLYGQFYKEPGIRVYPEAVSRPL